MYGLKMQNLQSHSIIEIYEGLVRETARSTAKRGQIEEVSTRSVFRVDEGKDW